MYRLAEVFLSVQGEGARTGDASVFLRFAGCNLNCTKATVGFDCDTDHGERMALDLAGLLEKVREVAGPVRWVVLTGGEPLLQTDFALLDGLKAAGFKVAAETNGTLALPDVRLFDWVTVSPKPADKPCPLAVRECHEFKLVLAPNTEPTEPEAWGVTRAMFKLLSPAFDGMKPDPAAVEWCIGKVLADPTWRLTYQAHKVWGVK